MPQEFQVIILAGGSGSRMYPLTEEIPKPLLPVANRPLISFQLELLERVGFTEVMVVTQQDIAKGIQKYVSDYKGGLQLSVEVLRGHFGTAEVLLKLKDKIKSDFIVISGDLIITEGFLYEFADLHRLRNSAVTVLLKSPHVDSSDEKAPKEVKEINEATDFIGLNEQGRLVYFSAKADIEDHLTLSKNLLKSFSNITLYTKLFDAHFYIFSRWVLDILEKNEKHMSSIKGELLPFLVSLQYKKKLQGKGSGIPDEVLNPTSLSAMMSSQPQLGGREVGCYAYVLYDGFCGRANTLPSYLEINKEVATGNTGYLPKERPFKNNFIHETAQIDAKTQVGAECVIGESTVIGEKCGVAKTVIGKHCKIGNNVKLRNCVVMDYVTILDGCTLQNSIICNNVYMKERCSIQDCQVGVRYTFEPNSKHKAEVIAEGE